MKKIVYDSPDVIIKYYYDGQSVLVETDGSGAVQRRYVYGNKIDEPIAIITSSGTYFYFYDALGNVTALTKYVSPDHTLMEKYSYDIFGKVTIRDGSGVIKPISQYGNPYMFTGREIDNETANYYYRARYYNPTTGRFISADPIGYRAGLNLYRYVNNNPVMWSDPYGLTGNGTFGPPPAGWGFEFGYFAYYGNWGGPGWTAGRWGTWNEVRDSGEKIADPIDKQDVCYMKHDKCYGTCRDNFPLSQGCDPDKTKRNAFRAQRKNCFVDCDRELSKCLYRLVENDDSSVNNHLWFSYFYFADSDPDWDS